MHLRLCAFALLAVSLSQGFPLPARAALGGDAASVEADRVHLKGEMRSSTAANYQLQVITQPSGTVLHEYLAAGRVFAVTWRGPLMPDLSQVLGGYFTRYAQAAARPAIRHRLVAVNDPDLVVSSSGHMRAFSGRAWVPSLLPAGFSVSDIR
ncbi:MAG TPA: DUF2844 domain-containing protein [Steroidobacteraceae bacterium]|nr:DUF2844 domain-containing protein [Steroidobacteraceae bacterium]